jgi:hypothetical protein
MRWLPTLWLSIPARERSYPADRTKTTIAPLLQSDYAKGQDFGAKWRGSGADSDTGFNGFFWQNC